MKPIDKAQEQLAREKQLEEVLLQIEQLKESNSEKQYQTDRIRKSNEKLRAENVFLKEELSKLTKRPVKP